MTKPPRFAARWIFIGLSLFLFSGKVIASPVPPTKPAAYPAWWFERDVIQRTANQTNPVYPTDYPAPDDYVVLIQGQLKHLAVKAYAEMQARLPASVWSTDEGGALTAAVNWNPSVGDNYAAVNQGQIKNLAMKFYNVLIEAGYTTQYPWTSTPTDDDNYAVVNLGQAKKLFSFDLTAATGQLPAWWQEYYFGSAGHVPEDDFDGDNLTNIEEYQQGSNPNNYYSQGSVTITPFISIVSGNNQVGTRGTFLADPLVIKITNGVGGTALNNAPVTFTVTQSDGRLATTNLGAPQTSGSLNLRTGLDGKAQACYLLASAAGTSGLVGVTSGNGPGAQFTLLNFNPYVAPAAATAVTAIQQNNGSVQLLWNDNSDNETGFTIRRSDDGGQTWITVGSVGANINSLSLPSTQAGTAGSSLFQVVVANAAGSSPSAGVASESLAPEEDFDEDGLSNALEEEIGALPWNKDSDGDGAMDNEDAFPGDADLKPPRVPDRHYAVIDMEALGYDGSYGPVEINDKCQVLGKRTYGQTDQWGNPYTRTDASFWEITGGTGSMTPIPVLDITDYNDGNPLQGVSYSYIGSYACRRLNNEGTVCGVKAISGVATPVTWTKSGGVVPLPAYMNIPGTLSSSGGAAWTINDGDRVYGIANSVTTLPNNGGYWASTGFLLWPNQEIGTRYKVYTPPVPPGG